MNRRVPRPSIIDGSIAKSSNVSPSFRIFTPKGVIFSHVMASGAVYKDLLPIPAEDPRKEEDTTTTLTDKPTESHALAFVAAKSPEEKGAAQVVHGEEVVDLGWNEPEQAVENPLVGGLSNEDLWVLVRRFNNVRIGGISKQERR